MVNEKKDLMNYDSIITKAMRDALRSIFTKAEEKGLVEDHYFVITFATKHKKVVLSNPVKEIYPEEITIILQHQFGNLKAKQECFEVELSFGGVPEVISVPYDAVINFADPSVNFELSFDDVEPCGDSEDFVEDEINDIIDEDVQDNLINFDLLLKNKK